MAAHKGLFGCLLLCLLPVSLLASDLFMIGFFPLTRTNNRSTELSGWAHEVRTAFHIALDVLNDDPNTLPGYTLRPLDIDTHADPFAALDEMRSLLLGSSVPPILGAVGPSSSSVALPLTWLSSALRVPLISYSATSTTFSDHSAYPYFYRTIPADEFVGRALADICKEMRVPRLAVLYSDDAYGRSGVAELTQFVGTSIEMTYVASHPASTTSSSSIDAILASVHNDFEAIKAHPGGSPTKTIVIITEPELAAYIFPLAVEEGMMDGYAWITSESLMTPSVWQGKPELQESMAGVVGVSPQAGLGVMAPVLADRYAADVQYGNYSDYYYGRNGSEISRWAPFVFDAALALAYGAQVTADDGGDVFDAADVAQHIGALNFSGASAEHLTFETNGDVSGAYSILNMQEDGDLHVVGSWIAHPLTNTVEMDLHIGDIFWPSGTHDLPFAPREWSCALIREPGNSLGSPWTSMAVSALKHVASEDSSHHAGDGFHYGYFADGDLHGNPVEAVLSQFEYFHDLGYQIYLAPTYFVVDVVGAQAAARYEEAYFIAVDAEVPNQANVYSILFSEDEGAYLAGTLAGLVTASKTVGVIAGPPFPPLKRFLYGFVNGVHHSCPSCDVKQYFAPGFAADFDPFEAPELGEEQAEIMVAAGADVIFGAAGVTGSAAIHRAAELGALVIGVDVDEYYTTFNNGSDPVADRLLTSVQKTISIPIEDALHHAFEVGNGTGPGSAGFAKTVVDGLESGAIHLAPCHQRCDVFNPHIPELEATTAVIIDKSLLTGVVFSSGNPFVQASDCPVGTQFVEASTPQDNVCQNCPIDFYNIDGDARCHVCPAGAVCRGRDQVKALAGYWRSSNASLGRYRDGEYSLIKCPLPFSCEGATEQVTGPFDEPPEQCLKGFRGNLCVACEDGYGHSGVSQGCQRCPDDEANAAIILGAAILFTFITIFMVRNQLKASGDDPKDLALVIKIVLSWLQVMTLFSTFEIDWPREVLAMFSAQGAPSAAGESIINIDCALEKYRDTDVPLVYQKALILSVCLPIVCLVMPFIVWSLVWLFTRFVMLEKPKWNFAQRVIVSIIVLLFLVHPNVVQSTLSLFTCIELEDGNWFLHADPNIPCSGSTHKRWLWGLGVPTFIVFVLGIPLAAAAVLYMHRHSLEAEETKKRYGFLYEGYRPKRFYWEAVITLRKVAIVIIDVSLATLGVEFQALGALLVIGTAYCAQLYQRPFTGMKFNHLEDVSLLVCFLTLYQGMLFTTGALDRQARVGLTVTIFLVNAAFVVYFVRELIVAARHLAKEKLVVLKRRRTLVKQRKSKMAAGNTVEMSWMTQSTMKLDVGKVLDDGADETKARPGGSVVEWSSGVGRGSGSGGGAGSSRTPLPTSSSPAGRRTLDDGISIGMDVVNPLNVRRHLNAQLKGKNQHQHQDL